MKRILPLILALCLMCFSVSYAVTLPKAPDGYVYDKANVISELTEEVIALNNQELAKAVGAEIFIVTLTDTGDYGSDDYAYMLLNQWGVGDEKEDNGVMFLLALRGGDDNGYALITGSGTEKFIPADDADNLLTDYFDNYYALGDYDSGILSLFEAVFCRVRDHYGLNLAYQDETVVRQMMGGSDSNGGAPSGAPVNGGNAPSEGGSNAMIWIIVIVVILVLVLGGTGRRRRVRRGPGMPPLPPRAPHYPMGGMPMGGNHRPPMGGAPMGGTPRSNPGSRPSGGLFGGGSSRPSSGGIFGGGSSSRPSSGSSSRTSFSRPSSAGRVTRGGGASHGSGARRGR